MNLISGVYELNEKLSPHLVKKLNELVIILNHSFDSKEVLNALSEIITQVKLELAPNYLCRDLKIIDGESHAKEVIFQAQCDLGILKVEKIQFISEVFTCLHTHPEYLVDEVIEGELIEREFKILINSQFQNTNTLIRPVSDRRLVYDPSGHPHIVSSSTSKCKTISVSLGFKEMEILSH